ncbi:MAG: hypothetical protein H6637_04290, partial [Ardenticatenales bacterium]|nr:hypothetical protein [Ardenticatenales bacterium]
ILADQVKSLDWRARRAEKMDGLPEAVVVELLQKLLLLLPMTIDTSGMEGE